MAELEQTLWTGRSSQWKNFGVFLLCILVIPIPWAIWKWLQTRCHIFELTTERLLIKTGVFNKKTETLELYRVRDLQSTQSFFQRMVGLENISLITSDSSTPELVVDFVSTKLNLTSQLRQQIEAARVKKRVREVDIE